MTTHILKTIDKDINTHIKNYGKKYNNIICTKLYSSELYSNIVLYSN